jgi:hypothetical protein
VNIMPGTAELLREVENIMRIELRLHENMAGEKDLHSHPGVDLKVVRRTNGLGLAGANRRSDT